MRLQKFLAHAGVASRRRAEDLIRQGEIQVNRQVITEMGYQVAASDEVTYRNRRLRLEEAPMVVLLNKPVEVVSTAMDQFGRTTVLDLLPTLEVRLYPVGRLDYHSSGLILLTNDGDLTYRLTHPRHHIPKTYRVRVSGRLNREDLNRFAQGLALDDYRTRPCEITEIAEETYEVILYEGRNRQLRRMMAVLGFEVISLERTAMGEISLEGLAPGEHRLLSPEEIEKLKKEAGDD